MPQTVVKDAFVVPEPRERLAVGVGTLIDDAILDTEHRAAMRRFLAKAARNDPGLFRCQSSPVSEAAAVAWVVATANRTIGSYRSPMTGKDLLAHFGVSGSVTDRTRTPAKG